jgi:hypothetical protein
LLDVFTAVKAVIAALYEKFIALLAQESQQVDAMHSSAFPLFFHLISQNNYRMGNFSH